MEVGGKKIIRRNKGKQKREMKKIQNKKSCQIAFAKRKDGIMKKANEVRALCAASVDLIMFSPTGKAYFYGDPSMKTIKMALSSLNEQEPGEEGDDEFLSYIMEGMSDVGMKDLIAKSDSLVDQLNFEKERGETLAGVLETVNNITNNKEIEEELLVLQKLLKDRVSINATAASNSHHHGDQTMVQVNTTGIIGSYPTHVNPFDTTTTRGIGDHNAPVWYPSDQHQQGYNGPFFYNAAGNGNGVGGGSGGDGGSGSHVYNSNYYNNNNNEGGIFGFPNENINNPFNHGGYGGGGFF